MYEQKNLTYMANLYMALADRTRLRLLNLMHEQEVCVAYFTDVLGDSQPKISRHLAYLRNVGIVETRRDGKWMHYRIKWPTDAGVSAVIHAALGSIAGFDDCQTDSLKFQELFGGNAVVRSIEPPVELDIYAHADMNESADTYESESSGSNDLEEFLL